MDKNKIQTSTSTNVKKLFNLKNMYTTIKWMSIMIIAITIIMLILFFTKGSGLIKTSWTTHSGTSLFGGNTKEGPGILQSRTMQVLITFVGGGALGLAGALLQKVTKNRLAEVSILGIGSLNIFFVYAYAMFFKEKAFGTGIIAVFMPIFLILVSIFGTLIVWGISRSRKANKNTFVIVGIALQLLVEALSVIIVNPSKLVHAASNSSGKKVWNRIKGYTLGRVHSGVDVSPQDSNPVMWWLIILALVIVGVVIITVFFLRRKIDTYETSEDLALSTGINIKRLRLVIYMLVALLAGTASAVLGSVALLGIIAPSIARVLFKNKMWPMTVASFLIGGIMVAVASFVSMQLEVGVSVGILSTAIVIPYFIILMIREK